MVAADGRSTWSLGSMPAYSETWRRFRLGTRLGVVAALLALPLIVLGALALDSPQWAPIGMLVLVVGGALSIVWVALYWRQLAFRCPRCGQYFFYGKLIVGKPFPARSCVNCGLRLFDEA